MHGGDFGDQWAEKLSYPVNVSFDIMALIATFGIAYRLAEKYDIDALSSGAIAVAAFCLRPLPDSVHTRRRNRGNLVSGGIPISLMGSKGLFVGMLIAMFSTEVYRWVVQRILSSNAGRRTAGCQQIIYRSDSGIRRYRLDLGGPPFN
ncbi:PTS transporter subunit EIIC [Bacillus licheniformis]|nr:PTS transporter subunit EIIC [Bacillus licheniformis]